MKNAYEVRGETTAIFVKSTEGMKEVMISTASLGRVQEFPGTFTAYWDNWVKGFYVVGRATIDGKPEQISLHRWVTNAPKGMQVDHINHDTLDNRSENLRVVTQAQNGQNRKGANKNSSTGIRGVHRRKNRYRASLKHMGKNYDFGVYKTLEEAERAVIEARKKFFPFSNEGIS